MNSIELLSLLLNILTLLLVLDTRAKLPKKKRREFELVEKKYTDLGGIAPLPEVDKELEARMKAYYCMIKKREDMKFTEKFIMRKFGATQTQARNIKAKWERDDILKRENDGADNSTHVLKSYGKLRKL